MTTRPPTYLSEWIARYQEWSHRTFLEADTPTPTLQQKEVLLTVHYRTVMEEYTLAGETVPGTIWSGKPTTINVTKPLLRLVHGLPGSGKSKLIEWLKEYFEVVWQWSRNLQYALLAPMNTMADNIGGSTIHSFGRIAFKDKRGMVIQSGRGAELGGSIFADEEYHELRFLLIDEIEAAGVGLVGRLEENVRLNVPQTSSTKALQRKQDSDRSRQLSFAGVNVLFLW